MIKKILNLKIDIKSIILYVFIPLFAVVIGFELSKSITFHEKFINEQEKFQEKVLNLHIEREKQIDKILEKSFENMILITKLIDKNNILKNDEKLENISIIKTNIKNSTAIYKKDAIP